MIYFEFERNFNDNGVMRKENIIITKKIKRVIIKPEGSQFEVIIKYGLIGSAALISSQESLHILLNKIFDGEKLELISPCGY